MPADLRGARLMEADSRDTDFTEADLHEAILRNTDAGGSVFHRADLRPADLRGVGLSTADLLQARPAGAPAGEHIRWPTGFDAVAAGVVVTEDRGTYRTLVRLPALRVPYL